MKLVAQIAGGIFFAGVLSWIFWLSIFAAAVPKITAEANRAFQLPAINFRALGPLSKPSPQVRVECVNFVQMVNGERRCLESAPRAEYRIEPATLPQTQFRPTAR
jgi:hypothetical protein